MSATYTIPEGGSAISYFTPRLDNSKDTIADNQTVWFDDITIELVEEK